MVPSAANSGYSFLQSSLQMGVSSPSTVPSTSFSSHGISSSTVISTTTTISSSCSSLPAAMGVGYSPSKVTSTPSNIPITPFQSSLPVFSQDFHAQLYSLIYRAALTLTPSSTLCASVPGPSVPTITPPSYYHPLHLDGAPSQQSNVYPAPCAPPGSGGENQQPLSVCFLPNAPTGGGDPSQRGRTLVCGQQQQQVPPPDQGFRLRGGQQRHQQSDVQQKDLLHQQSSLRGSQLLVSGQTCKNNLSGSCYHLY